MAMAAVYTTVNGMILSETRGGTETIYIPDTLGSLVECRDSSGTKTYSAEYWPYGEVQTSTGANPSSWGFVGLLGYLMDLANLLYVRARHYRPGYARWQTVDPLWPSENPFGYCGDMPIMYADPAGLETRPRMRKQCGQGSPGRNQKPVGCITLCNRLYRRDVFGGCQRKCLKRWWIFRLCMIKCLWEAYIEYNDCASCCSNGGTIWECADDPEDVVDVIRDDEYYDKEEVV